MRYTTEELLEFHEKYGTRHYGPHPGFVLRGAKARSAILIDTDANIYDDFAAGYSAVNGGHSVPEFTQAFSHITMGNAPNQNPTEELILFRKELCELLGYQKALVMCNGVDVVETAIKMARKWGYTKKGVPPGRANIVAFKGGFHGRTTTVTGFTAPNRVRAHFAPYADEGFKRVPFGDLNELALAINDNTVAVLLEVIQGEGGINFPPDDFLIGVAALCRKYNLLLIADEIQTGLGRTGKLLASDWYRVKPDMVLLGKSLGAGITPVSAVVGWADCVDVFDEGEHGLTHGGNPHGAAVARKVLEVMVRDDWCGRSLEMGGYLSDKLKRLKSPFIRDVRGKGLFIGVEIETDKISVGAMHRRFVGNKIITAKAKDTIRLTPPLTITRYQIDEAFPRIAQALGAEGY